MRVADWDFFTSASGAKPGYLENISQGGCLVRTTEAIEHRRWIRLVLKEPQKNLWFTAVGRVLREEPKLESWDENTVTLFRYGVEFIHPLNPLVIEALRQNEPSCATCGEPSAPIVDAQEPETHLCVLCHLRKACSGLLSPEGLDRQA